MSVSAPERTVYVCELAWLPRGEVQADVVIEIADGRFVHGHRPARARPLPAAGTGSPAPLGEELLVVPALVAGPGGDRLGSVLDPRGFQRSGVERDLGGYRELRKEL